MAKTIVKIFVGDPEVKVKIKSERMDRKDVLMHLCRHSGQQFLEAYRIAKKEAKSSNIAGYAISVLWSMNETA